MERTLLPHQSSNLEENEIDLVLEQLQESGFSSFFDHPDCPFSSIQEVDEALKELENEFLKICKDKETKSHGLQYRSRATVGPSPSSSTLNNSRIKNKLKEYQNESRFKFGTGGNSNRKEPARKRIGDCLKSGSKSIGNSQINNESDDHEKDKNMGLASGDTTEVCAIDNSGNKYSLKIEVFATVKLENDDNDESVMKLEQCQSSPKLKVKKSFTSLEQSKKSVGVTKKEPKMVSRDECENCPPLLLSYRSSMCKPCPSYMNPTASDLRKTVTYLRAKPDPFPIKPDGDHLKLIKNNVSTKMFYEVTQAMCHGQTDEKSVQETPLPPPDSIFGLESLVNHRAVDRQDEISLHKTEENDIISFESRSIQTINLNCDANESTKLEISSLDALLNNCCNVCQCDQKSMLTQEQQTSFEILKTLTQRDQEDVSTSMSSQTCFKCDVVDEGINTSVLSMFNFSRVAQGILSNISEGSNSSPILKQRMSHSDMSCHQLAVVGHDQNVKTIFIKSDGNSDFSRRSISDELLCQENVVYIDIGTGPDSAEVLITYNPAGLISNEELTRTDVEQIEEAVLTESEIDKSDERVPLESSSKETVILRSSGSILKEKDRLTTIKEESVDSTEFITTDDSSFALIDKIDIGVGHSEELIIVIDKSPTLVDREVDCKSKPSVTDQGNTPSTSVECKIGGLLDVFKIGSEEKRLVDREVWMSKEVISKALAQKMVDKEVHMSTVVIKNKSTMMDKEIGSRLYKRDFVDKSMVDKDIETVVESKSMCTFIDDALKVWSEKGITTGISEQSVDLSTNTPSSDLSWMRESSSEQESPKRDVKKSEHKFSKWSGSKTFGAKFKKSDPKATNSEKVMKTIRERREKRKSDEGGSKKESISKRNKLRQEQTDKDSNLNSASSTEQQPRVLSGYRKPKEMSEYETKFVKGVFSRHGSSGKNKLAMKRRAFSNLDQKILASRLARSKKSMGSMKASKKSVWEQSKLHKSEQPLREKSNNLSATSATEYKLPDNTVINTEE